MENKVNFIAYAENVPDDVNNLQTYVSDSIDHVVLDTIVSGSKFSGFVAAKNGPASVTVTAGRLYKNGIVYAKDTPTTYDFTSQLPVAAKKKVIITAWGSEIDTGATPRNVLIAAQSTPQNPVYQPQILEITHSRAVNLGTTIGAEAPDPADPTYDASLLLIATVVLTPTGVESVTQATANEVANLTEVDGRVSSLEQWESTAAPMLTSIASDISRLSNDLRGGALRELTGRMLQRVAVLEAKEGIPSNATDSSADFFITSASSDVANILSNTKVNEGVRFADDGANDVALQLFNPLNPDVMTAGGVLFPAYDTVTRIQPARNLSTKLQLSAYTYQTVDYVQKTMSRVRVRWGDEYIVCTNSYVMNTDYSYYGDGGTYDTVSHIFTLHGETFLVDPNSAYAAGDIFPWHGNRLDFFRARKFWYDTYEEPYWDIVTQDFTITGSSVEETFPCGQDMWLASIDLAFSSLDSSGPVSVVLCECTSTGEVDTTKVLGSTTLAYSSLRTFGNGDWTTFTFTTPIFLKAGNRYGFRVVTAANHYVQTVTGPSFPQGMFFTMIGGYGVADPQKHLYFRINTCKFRQTLVNVDLQGLQLSGGIVGIDILAGSIAPTSTSMTFSVQVNGKWIPLDLANAGTLNSGGALPPLLPFRATFQGSPEMMPCVSLMTSNVHVSRPKTSFTHIWPKDGRTLPSPSSTIRLLQRYENYDAALHSVSVKLLTGASYATETSPSSYSDVTAADGAIERTYVWNLGSAVSSYKIKSTGTSSTPLIPFHIAWFKDWVI